MEKDVNSVFCREKSVIMSQRDRVAVTGTDQALSTKSCMAGNEWGSTQMGYFGVINGICKMQSC